MILLSSMFPLSTGVSEAAIPAAYGYAVSRVSEVMKLQIETMTSLKDPIGAPLCDLGLPKEAVCTATTFWSAFTRTDYTINAWSKLEPLLCELLAKDGSFDNSVEDLDRMASCLETAVRAVWYIASPDGRKPPEPPSPLAGVRSAAQVRANHINPVFVGGNDVHGARYEARGSIVGLPAMGLEQLMHAQIAAVTEKNIRVNYFMNIGQLCFRVSSAGDVMTNKNRERSAKAISALGVDSDEAAFGNRSEKLKMCALQRSAFNFNLDIVKPLVTGICAPKSESFRARGDWRAVEYIKSKKRQYEASGVVSEESAMAMKLFAEASGIGA